IVWPMTLFRNIFILTALVVSTLLAQNPSAREDAEADRRKILRAADLVDSIQAAQEQLQTEVTDLKSKIKSSQETVENLQSENQKLRGDLLTLKTAIEKSEEARLKEREALLKEIASVVAEKTKSYPQSHGDALLHVREEETTPTKKVEKEKPEKTKESSAEKETGFYHVVEKGHTLSSIADAYRQQGINVTIDDIRKANNLTKKDVIHVGQKLFIPKK
ncbi:MAG: LysM peptidoglycan-binding domain-containing protein, partial [Verrucomicrobiota bacterium]